MKTDPASLDRLHDIVVPPAAPWWPPAPGWDCVLVLVLLIVLVLLVRGFIHWQRNRYRREALAEFRRLERRLHDPAQRVAALTALAALLKRVALTAYPRGEVASLTGAMWFDFLDRTGGTTAFRAGVGGKLAAAAYAPVTVIDMGDNEAAIIAASVRDWISGHRPGLLAEGYSLSGKEATSGIPITNNQ
jgi:hypothetical protein